MTLEQRVGRLETQNRWAKGAASILFGCCAAGILMAQGSPKQEPLSAAAISLVDETGKEHLWIGRDKDGRTQVALKWKEGEGLSLVTKPGASSSVHLKGVSASAEVITSAGSSMMLQSRKGAKTAMAWLKCEPTGVVKLDLLHLGPRKNAQIAIGIDQNGIPYFRIEDSRGNDLVKLTLEEDESPSLTFYDKKGKVIWKAPTK